MKKVFRNNGFTIIEVLVSVIILTLSLLMLLNMAMIALDGNDWSNQATRSTQLIQQKIEELRTSKNFVSGVDSVNSIQRAWTVSNPSSHLRRVDITASWRNRRGVILQNSMTSFIRSDSI